MNFTRNPERVCKCDWDLTWTLSSIFDDFNWKHQHYVVMSMVIFCDARHFNKENQIKKWVVLMCEPASHANHVSQGASHASHEKWKIKKTKRQKKNGMYKISRTIIVLIHESIRHFLSFSNPVQIAVQCCGILLFGRYSLQLENSIHYLLIFHIKTVTRMACTQWLAWLTWLAGSHIRQTLKKLCKWRDICIRFTDINHELLISFIIKVCKELVIKTDSAFNH